MRASNVLRLAVCAALVCSVVVAVPAPRAEAVTPGWKWLNPLPNGEAIQAVAMSPTSGSTCTWVVGNYGLIMKTFDYGQSWHPFQPAGLGTKTLMDIDLSADSVGWAVGEDGTIVKISDDWKVTLQTAPAGTDDLYAVDVVDATHAWAVGYNGDIIKTVDGVTWTMVLNDFLPNTAFTCAQFTPSGDGWVGGLNNGGTNNIFYINGGNAYNKSTADTTFAVDDLVVDIAANTIIAVGRNGSSQPLCYKTVDPNIRFAQPGLTPDVSYGSLPTGAGVTGWLSGLTYVDSTHWWVSTTYGEVLRHDGLSFTEITSPYPQKYFNDIEFRLVSGPAYLGVVVGDGGLMGTTTSGGTSWTKRSSITDEALLGLDFVSATTGYATSGTDIIKTTNSGANWTKLATGQGSYLLDTNFLANGTGWAVGPSSTALFYNGTNWISITSDLSPALELRSVSYLDAAHVWVCGPGGAIAKGTGTSWTMSTDSDATSGSWRSIDFFDADHGIAVGLDGKVVWTDDGGVTWTAGVSGEAAGKDIYSVDMVSATTAYMVGNSGTAAVLMKKSTDGGKTWTTMTQPAGVDWQTLDDVSFADANNGWIVGGNGTLMHTTNGGDTWTSEQMSTAWLSSVSAVSSTAAWAGGYNGAILTNYVAPAPPALTTVYRFFNMKNGSHLYTADVKEKLKIIATWPDIYRFEDVGYVYAAYKAGQPLYRFRNVKTGSHFYTATEDEKEDVLAKWPDILVYEGPAYNVSNTPVAGATTVWRFFRKDTGSHFYTADPAEVARVKANWPTIYTYEGEAFWLPQ